MESFDETQHDEHGGQQPDPIGAETAPVVTPGEGEQSGDPTPEESSADSQSSEDSSPSESTDGQTSETDSSLTDQTDGSSEGSGDQPPESSSSESETSSDAPSGSEETETASDQAAEHEDEGEPEHGLLAGTGTELQPGVGGLGDHPAPAVMRDPVSGELHSAGQPPSGWGALETAPEGDTTDLTDEKHSLDPEAAEELNRLHEPEQIETERPDLGTE